MRVNKLAATVARRSTGGGMPASFRVLSYTYQSAPRINTAPIYGRQRVVRSKFATLIFFSRESGDDDR